MDHTFAFFLVCLPILITSQATWPPSGAPAAPNTSASSSSGGEYAHCKMVPGDAPTIAGGVDFRILPGNPYMDIKLNISGLVNTNQIFAHGLHVTEYGDLVKGCLSFGNHWNPYGNNHGGRIDPPDMRHVGDFGNVFEDDQGNIRMVISDYYAKLSGPNSIMGRGLVLTADRDDLGLGSNSQSLEDGNSGGRLGCCIIGYTDSLHWF